MYIYMCIYIYKYWAIHLATSILGKVASGRYTEILKACNDRRLVLLL